LVSCTKERTWIESVREQGAEENIWTEEEVAGAWRKLLNKELHNLYASINVTRLIKPWRTSWLGHAARMGEMRRIQNFGWENVGTDGRKN
jgi:hypothetical protein